MAKHFEHLWEEAEMVSKKHYGKHCPYPDVEDNAYILASFYETSSAERKEELFGMVLFALCWMSKEYDINAYTALRSVIDDMKQKALEEVVSEHNECLDCDALIDLHREDKTHCACDDLDCTKFG